MSSNNDKPLLDFFNTKRNTSSTLPPISSLFPPVTPSKPLSDFLPPIKPRTALDDLLGLPLIAPKPQGIRLKIVPPAPKNKTELIDRVKKDVTQLLTTDMKIIKARQVPAPQEIASNEAKEISTSVLHVDMRKSSQILEIFDPITALRIYKAYHAALVATARLKDGRIRTFAGDRIGVVFDLHETRQRSIAVETAIMMDEVIKYHVNPILLQGMGYEIEFGIGVDFGQMFVGRIGQTGSDNNNLAWVGTAMNRASKLADIPEPGVYISSAVYDSMAPVLKDESMMWQAIKHPEYGLIHKWILNLNEI